MHRKLMLLVVCSGAAFCYASENRELVVEKKVGIFSVINKRQHHNVFEDRFYHGTVEGGKLYAVYDGHGGPEVAEFLAKNFSDYFSKTSGLMKNRMVAAFKNAYNDDFVKLNNQSGSTASVVFIKDNSAYFAHVGDSRMVLGAGGKVGFVTSDHKPNRADEYVRIEDAKGLVFNKCVNGFLAVSRAIGDYGLDKRLIIAEPEYTEVLLTEKNKFLVLATNGLWDVVTNEDVVTILKAKRSRIQDMNLLAELLANYAVVKGSRDDITVMVVDLLS